MQSKNPVRPLTIVLTVVVVAMVGYLTLALIGPIDLPWQRVTATMQLEPTVDGTRVRVLGTTDLPDGAVIDYWFERDDVINEGPVGAVEVRDGRFAFEHDMTDQRRGRWDIQASFSTVWGSQQPRHINDLFGAQGEHLAGPQVYVDSPGDEKQLLVTTSVILP